MGYREKLKHNYHELTAREKLRYKIIDRFFLPGSRKFFFEGCAEIPGQMYWQERQELYNSILNTRPNSCFEIGTYTGGGSTFFLASAFSELGRGKVYTLEANRSLFERAKRMYAQYLPGLLPYVEFIFGDSPESFIPFIHNNVECFFLDGSDNRQESVGHYQFFMDYLQPGSIMIAHDWDSEKQVLLKPIIENNTRWKLILKLGLPESVGFVIYRYTGPQ